jgi:hypothetical protein
MFSTAKRSIALFAVILAFLLSTSCSSGPTGPVMGTPAFYWAAAKETFAAGDYTKTLEHLDKLLAGNNEYKDRALAWDLALTSGLAGGYIDLSEAFDTGAKSARSAALDFRRQASNFRTYASRLALQQAERLDEFNQAKADTVPVVFGYPKGSAADVPQLAKVLKGVMPLAADMDMLQKRCLERAVLLAVCGAVGAPNDTAKAQQLLAGADAKAPRAAFQMAMATSLQRNSQIYARDKLDQPDKATILLQRASESLKGVPESKDSKALGTKIQDALKKLNKK